MGGVAQASRLLPSGSFSLKISGPLINVAKRSMIYQPFSMKHHLYLVKQGCVQLYKYTDNGRKTIVAMLGNGEFFSNMKPYNLGDIQLYAETKEDTSLIALNQHQLEVLYEQDSSLYMAILTELNQQLSQRNKCLEAIVFATIKERIVHLFAYLVARLNQDQTMNDGKVNIYLTHWEIASFIGSSRETVSSLMKELVNEGIVHKKQRYYYLEQF